MLAYAYCTQCNTADIEVVHLIVDVDHIYSWFSTWPVVDSHLTHMSL